MLRHTERAYYLPLMLRHTERAYYFTAHVTAHGACLLLYRSCYAQRREKAACGKPSKDPTTFRAGHREVDKI